MSVRIQAALRCEGDGCYQTFEREMFGIFTRSDEAAMRRAAKGWSRFRPSATDRMKDFCPDCTGKQSPEKATKKASRS